MGVMPCYRKDCKNILCRKYSGEYGYICDDCFEEMKVSRLPVQVFMATSKKDIPDYNYENAFR